MDRLASAPSVPGARTLDVEPFHGVRFSPTAVPDPATVTSPPYDVVDAAGVHTLESTDAHNVVRLILPRADDCGPEGRYRHAAATLRAWLGDGTLQVERSAGIYVYEQSFGGTVLQRGLIGAVGLHDPADLVILPHEDTMAGPVADRLELMRTGEANIEPIFLVYSGGVEAAEVIERTSATRPLIDAATGDGISHRLWALTDRADLAVVQTDLAGRTAMIADGHHRYAAYRALQSELHASTGPGPWDYGLALLVDLDAFPPQVGAIHRVIRGLPLDRATALAEAAGFVATAVGEVEAPELDIPSGHWMLVDAAGSAVRLTHPNPEALAAMLPNEHSAAWRSLDTAVLHHVLLERVWQIDDDQVTYHHSASAALHEATAEPGGLAVLLAPVPIETVFEIAASGERMPRKSTSFGPKPRTGWVLRIFSDGSASGTRLR